MKKIIVAGLYLIIFAINAVAQYNAQQIQMFNMTQAGITPRNYSGITHISGNKYALVSDKERTDGFYIFSIEQDSTTGKIISVKDEGFHASTKTNNQRDCEGICMRVNNGDTLLYISGENDQHILEYSIEGIPTGKKLKVPAEFSIENIQGNYGFEALCYSPETKLFWTTTENALKKDITNTNDVITLRLQSFNDKLKPVAEYIYKTDKPQYISQSKRNYAFGVSEVCALPDSSLIVLEREFIVAPKFIGSKTLHNLYIVKPTEQDTVLEKHLLYSFGTKLSITSHNLANFEGMCLGKALPDGKQTLLLVNDSQAGAGNKIFSLQDYISVISFSLSQPTASEQ